MHIKDLIDQLDLAPHPEGGYFKETYRSKLQVSDLKGFSGPRSSSTGIYFLLTSENRSHLHRIQSDEMWHFYQGSALRVVMIDELGHFSEQLIGPKIDENQVFQYVVPAGVWFGAEVLEPSSYSLVGCTVAPGFDFSDFELAKKKELQTRFPHHRSFIEEFCLE